MLFMIGARSVYAQYAQYAHTNWRGRHFFTPSST
jgi:hypothetical protein